MTARVLRGHLFHVAGDTRLAEAAAALVSIRDGALAVDETGRIAWLGPFADLPAAYADLPVTRADFLLPGFVDTHLHYPQVHATAAYGGGQLLHWLDHCIFPTEARLADEELAARAAADFVARRIAAGTTTALVFGSAFPAAQDALFQAHAEAGLRLVSGRGVQTVGPDSARPLITGEDEALALVADEVDRWHGRDADLSQATEPSQALLQVAVVPRFALSVTRRTLRGLGELYTEARTRGVYFHTHLSENQTPDGGEVAAVRGLYEVDSYLDTYDGRFEPGSRAGGETLLGRRSVFAHAVHCTDAELARLAETQSSIAHCPTSQQFLGSGTMPWRRTTEAGVTVALGSDVGAGDRWLIPGVLNDAYKVHLSEPGAAAVALHPAELLHTGTLAGAQALDQDAHLGNFDVGKDADVVLVDLAGAPALARRLEAGAWPEDPDEADVAVLFTLLMELSENAIRSVVVKGHEVVSRPLRLFSGVLSIGRPG
ncbi:amidohydrolase family protein [Microlunatus antarcticus]|uniref:Guanine deaminase n=1 Tax=Microlunatus antarcticus TaxID=53388 RepID=A0A7W5P8X4_9ACTN|nr:guanine deaminase [Microlunatus antarcticus]